MRISDGVQTCALPISAPGQADDEEVVANAAASDYCVNQDELNGFIARIAPFFKEERVVRFAQRINVHPGLVVGQLQRRLKRYDLFRRSEEHTSELQSLMRISYAVFCLKKKKHNYKQI